MCHTLLVGVSIFCSCPQPHVPVPVAPAAREHFPYFLRSFRQQKPVETTAGADQIEQISAPCRIGLIVEDVRQRGAEHPLPTAKFCIEGWRLLIPSQGRVPVRRRRAPAGMIPPRHLAAALGPLFRITKITGRRLSPRPFDFRAADPRIEGGVGPFDLGKSSHLTSELQVDRENLTNRSVLFMF